MYDDLSQYEFGPFRLDPLNRLLTRNSEPVSLAPRVFDTLVTLIRLRSQVVTKEELFRAVWSGSFVEESNLTVTISALRKVLDDGGGKQKYVQTVPKFGYRFVGQVSVTTPDFSAPAESKPMLALEPAVAGEARPAIPNQTASWILLAVALVLLAGFSVALLNPPKVLPFDRQTGNAATPPLKAHPVAAHDIVHSSRLHSSLLPAAATKPCGSERDAIAQGRRGNEVLALYLKGRYSSSRGTETGLAHGVTYFSKAIAADPCNALAYSGLADTYLSLPGWSVQSPEVAYRKAAEAAARALELDNSLPQAHTTLGMLAMIQNWDFALAEQEFRGGVELGPNESLAHQGLGIFLATRGRLRDALREMEIARDLDPVSLDIAMKLGLIRYYLRQYPEAIAEYKKVIELDPHYSVAHYMLGVTYFVEGDFKNAARELKESSGLVNDREPLAYGLYTAARFRMGDEASARSVRREFDERSRKEFISPTSMAVFCIGLGRLDQSLDWIDRMFQDHMLDALLVNVDPLFDPVRSDRRVVAWSAKLQ
jgi:DNA-binding winged helix-turn-helix (wHTH) protein/tetratricopeptide (TPR) repeat protein